MSSRLQEMRGSDHGRASMVLCRSTLLPSAQRSPSSRVRHAVGRLNDLARSPGRQSDSAHSPGPLEESMSQHGAFGRPSDGVEAAPADYAEPLTWEELFSVQTRASLELRVRPKGFSVESV